MTQTTKTVRSTKQAISIVNAIVGGALFGAGAIVFAIYFFLDNATAVLVLQITGGSLALSGVIELVIAAAFRAAYRRERLKLEQLKTTGTRFPAQITRIIPHLGARFGRSFSARAECTYENHERKTCLVKSQSFLYKNAFFHPFVPFMAAADIPTDDYTAWVYVNPRNPHDYAVELFAGSAEIRADYDYR